MATDNPRIAAYVPKVIHERIKQFKDDRELKSESQAITIALSEFFGVSQEVAYQSSSDLVQRIDALEQKLNHIKDDIRDELLSELKDEPLNLDNPEIENDPLSESQGELFIEAEEPTEVEVEPIASEGITVKNSEPRGSLLGEPLTASNLSRRFGLDRNAVAKARHKHKNSPEKFQQWLQAHDPNGLKWKYREDEKLYYPVSSS